VLGAAGQLGGDLIDAGRARGHQMTAVTRAGFDITSRAAVERVVRDARGADAVINCAAWTRVDAAEDHEREAAAVNAVGAGIVATACAAAGLRLCHLSTDYVFDGDATEPIDEDARPAPRTAYGRTKLEGEREVEERCPDHLIVRTSWLYGRQGPNFVLTILRLASDRREVRVVDDQRGSPTWTGHLAPALLRLLEIAPPGTYHLTNSGSASWRDLAAAAVAGRDLATNVVPITSAEYPTAARRPRYSVLDNRRWRELGEDPLPAWELGLASYLATLPSRARQTPGA